jgi:hypothetical protein
MIGIYAISLLVAVPIGISALWTGMGNFTAFLCYCASGMILFLALAVGLPDKDPEYCGSGHNAD